MVWPFWRAKSSHSSSLCTSARTQLGRHEGLQGRPRDDAARRPHAADQAVAVDPRRQEVGADGGRGQRIGRHRMNRARRFGAQLRHADGHAGKAVQDALGRVGIAGVHEEELHVGLRELRRALDETVRQPRAQRQDALARQRVARHLPRQPPAARHLVQRHRVLHAPVHARRVVVDVVLAHLRQRVRQRDAEPGQQRGIAHARQLQQLRRLHRAQAQQRFAARAHHVLAVPAAIGQADAAPALEQQPRDARAALDRQVGPARGRFQVAVHHAPASPRCCSTW